MSSFNIIVYLVDHTYSVDHNLNKFGYNWFLNNNYQVHVFDLSKLRVKKSENKPFKLEKTNYNFIDSYKSLDFYLSKYDRQKTLFFKIISVDMRIDYKVSALLHSHNFIVIKQKLGQIPIGASSIYEKLNFSFSYIYYRLRNLFFEILAESFIENHILVFAGSISNTQTKKYFHRLSVNSSDYNKYLDERLKTKLYDNYAVFLDEYVPYHVDSELTNQSAPVEDSLYYKRLNIFFENVEKITNATIIIAAHPSAKYSKLWNPFNGRKIIYNETPNLIQFSDFVIGHSSTAFTFAILFHKKCLFIFDSSCYGKRYINGIISFANYTGGQLFDLKYPFDFKSEILMINKEKYKDFINKFVREDFVPEKNSFEILIDYLNNLPNV